MIPHGLSGESTVHPTTQMEGTHMSESLRFAPLLGRILIAILFALYSGKPARDILTADAIALFERLGLKEHLTPQRSNGFRSMVERIKSDARAALATAA